MTQDLDEIAKVMIGINYETANSEVTKIMNVMGSLVSYIGALEERIHTLEVEMAGIDLN